MNITEFMSFDLEWFTTLPGVLITGGVIVLLIALIIFIISNKKNEKKKEEEKEKEAQAINEVNNEMPVMPPQIPINELAATVNVPVVPEVTAPVVNNENMSEQTETAYTSAGSVNILGDPQTNGMMPPVSSAVDIPTFFDQNISDGVGEVPVVNNTSTTNVIDFSSPVVNDMANQIPATNNVGANVNEGVLNPQINPVVIPQMVVEQPQEMINNQFSSNVMPSVVEEKPMIYGGVNPVNTVNTVPAGQGPKPVIYGGADPLENTTSIPRITNHEAYNVGVNNNYVTASAQFQAINEQNAQPEVIQKPVEQAIILEETTPTVLYNNVIEQPMSQQMPMTGAELFETNNIANNSGFSNSSSEIETLEF